MTEIRVYSSKPEGFVSQVSVSAAWLAFQGQYLLLQRSATSQEALRWGIVGGKVEPNEEPIDALRREVFEETTITLTASEIVYLDTCFVSKPEWNYTFHMFYYPLTKTPTVELSSEHQDYTWVSIDDIQTLPLMLGAKEALDLFTRKAKKLGML